VTAVVADGEAETGPGHWRPAGTRNKFLDPRRDGVVLSILHLNGYKIANPTVLARIDPEELIDLFRGYGYTLHVVEGSDPEVMHRAFAAALDRSLDHIAAIQRRARVEGTLERPRWPMIVLRSPKGWTGPVEVDGHRVEGTWRSHQLPFANAREDDGHRKVPAE
jgi:xylulose-5-phosphate/fructose-6-phosphate phosphoketolase